MRDGCKKIIDVGTPVDQKNDILLLAYTIRKKSTFKLESSVT